MPTRSAAVGTMVLLSCTAMAQAQETPVDEVIVTAQRRTEPLSRIAAPVSAVTGEQLRDANTPESEMLGKQIATTVNRAMDALPDDLRTAITLREIEGLSYEEIANVMNCPIGTVRSRIFRAREAIATELRPLLGTDKDRRW